uniref:Papilin-like n=1 Tax=Crassostrea virginica TaxID=6565 RepID=A0A8B8DXC6_CRAVI|nr:papilin-like [Crassostrea virginica]
MLRFGVLVLFPLVLGFAPPGPRYGTIGSNNQGNNGQTPGLNMGSSGANVRMTVNNMNTGNQPQNRPNRNSRNDLIPSTPYNSDVPYHCTLDSDRGYFCPYRYERPSTRYYFNVYSGRCESFYYRGCGGNPNSYTSREECVRSCACFTYADYGNYPCYQPSTYRWFFNKYSGTCQSFYYSGCNGGNDNNFQSQLECQSTCGPRACNGPWCNYGIDMGPVINENNAPQSQNAIRNAAAQSPSPANQPALPNVSQQPMPVNINAPMPNAVNVPMPNGVNVPMPIGVNVPMPNGENIPMLKMPNTPQPEPINEVNMVQGSMGNNAMTNALNGGSNGISMNSVAQIWNMASNAMNADTTSNGMSMVYPNRNQMKPGMAMY